MLGGILLWVIFLLLLVGIVMTGGKVRHYAVYTADNSVEFYTRRALVWEAAGTAVFRDSNNHRVIMSKHWILKIVELPKVDWEKMKKESGNVN